MEIIKETYGKAQLKYCLWSIKIATVKKWERVLKFCDARFCQVMYIQIWGAVYQYLPIFVLFHEICSMQNWLTAFFLHSGIYFSSDQAKKWRTLKKNTILIAGEKSAKLMKTFAFVKIHENCVQGLLFQNNYTILVLIVNGEVEKNATF